MLYGVTSPLRLPLISVLLCHFFSVSAFQVFGMRYAPAYAEAYASFSTIVSSSVVDWWHLIVLWGLNGRIEM